MIDSEFRAQVRAFLGDGESLFTDEDIDGVAALFPRPEPRIVARRLNLMAKGKS